MTKHPLVSIIIINFNGAEHIPSLFTSIHKLVYPYIEIIFVDNNSSDNSLQVLDNTINSLDVEIPLTILEQNKNLGFAEANNVAAQKASGKYLLFQNTDTTLSEDALDEMVRVAEKHKKIAGVAPKIYLSRFLPEKIFDSIGICIDDTGSPFNRGIGQIDMGQYDKEERIMGACFASALINRDIYLKIGGLDDSYFAYFEDVDWCFRAHKSGYHFYTAPKAIIKHYHSATSSKNSYAWKYYLIFRNYLRTVTKSFGKKSVLRIIPKKLLDLTRTLLNKNTDVLLKKSIIKVIINYLVIDWWKYCLKRNETRKSFHNDIQDEVVFWYSIGEPSSFFDPQTYKPKIGLEMYSFIINKLVKDNGLKSNEWKILKKKYYCAHGNNNEWLGEYINFLNMHRTY